MPYDDAWLIGRMLANPDLARANGQRTTVLPATAPEKDLQEQVRQLCKQWDILYHHTWKSQHSTPGFPDCAIVHGEALYLWELKREGKEPSPAQRRWLEAFAKVTRVESGTYWPKDWPHLVALLTRKEG